MQQSMTGLNKTEKG